MAPRAFARVCEVGAEGVNGPTVSHLEAVQISRWETFGPRIITFPTHD